MLFPHRRSIRAYIKVGLILLIILFVVLLLQNNEQPEIGQHEDDYNRINNNNNDNDDENRAEKNNFLRRKMEKNLELKRHIESLAGREGVIDSGQTKQTMSSLEKLIHIDLKVKILIHKVKFNLFYRLI